MKYGFSGLFGALFLTMLSGVAVAQIADKPPGQPSGIQTNRVTPSSDMPAGQTATSHRSVDRAAALPMVMRAACKTTRMNLIELLLLLAPASSRILPL